MKLHCRRAMVLALAALMAGCGVSAPGADRPLTTTMASEGHEMESAEGNEHEHGLPIDLTGFSVPPSVTLNAQPDGSGGVRLEITVEGLELVAADPPVDHRPGQGHIHVVVDGHSVAMLAETYYHVTDLTDGHHTVMVTLSSNDHRDYYVDGRAIGVMSTVMVEGRSQAVEPDARFEVEVKGGTVEGGIPRLEAAVGDLVEVTVRSDVTDDVHLHVYDLSVAVLAGMPAVMRVEADIPGIFEAELHEAGFKVFELEVS